MLIILLKSAFSKDVRTDRATLYYLENQAWNFTDGTKAMGSVALLLALGCLKNIPINIQIF